MRLNDHLTRTRGIVTLSAGMGEIHKRRPSPLYFLLILLVNAFPILIVVSISQKLTEITYAFLAGMPTSCSVLL